MSSAELDPRVTPMRPGLAAETLRDRVQSDCFARGDRRMVTAAVAPVRRSPASDAPLDTEALRGETVTVYDEAEGWCWVQLGRDDYVGYMPNMALGPCEEADAVVRVLRTFIYPGPSIKLPVCGFLTFGATCRAEAIDDGFARIAEGFVFAKHLHGIDVHEPDFVAAAERFLEVPYLWGGKSSLGIDCSGLLQLALLAAGVQAPRDSNMQARLLGREIDPAAGVRRGDLVFWQGHVGIMRNATELLHANAHAMLVSSEVLADARHRIHSATGTDITCIRRFDEADPRSGQPALPSRG